MMESYDKVQTNYIERTLRNYFQKCGNYSEKEILITANCTVSNGRLSQNVHCHFTKYMVSNE